MSPPDLRRASEVFEAALLREPAERERWLGEACAGDAALGAEVRSLLDHHARAEGFLSAPALAGVLGTAFEGELVLRTLGRYRILERLGAGGMGVVYLAEQDNPRRKVALKVLRPGSGGSRGRFAHEAELLGRLQHEGIAQIHEAIAGDAATGAPPYFAMEYVEGRPLTVYAAEHGLDLRARLALLVEVCAAVQHAHQKGVVHRDLKPANILVDASGQPKVLDFGVARAIDADLRAATLRTHPGEIVGTLAYMSPEQASGDPERLDTRADVYGLGVVAYELLAGRLPFELAGLALPEAVRTIQEVEPPLLGRFARALAGDVETIVAKALEKEPERRYASASELAADLARFLADEPILARPPSTLYQLRKFARRNAALVGGAAAFVLLLAVGLIVIGRLAFRLAEQRDHALLLQAEAERQSLAASAAEQRADASRRTAEDEAAAAKAVSGFLEDVLAAAEPYVGGKDATVAEAVGWAKERVDERFADRPDLAAAIRQRFASIHYSRGELDEALEENRASLAQFEESAGEDPLAVAFALATLGGTLQEAGNVAEAEAKLRESVALYRAHGGPDDEGLLTALTTLSANLLGRGAYAEAEPMMRDVLARRARVLGPEHRYTLTSRNNLVILLLRTGRGEEALPMLRELMETSRRTLSTSHPNTILSIYNYGDTLRDLGRFEEAEELLREAVALGAEHLTAGHWHTGLHRSRLGELLLETGRLEEAETELVAGYHVLATSLGADHARTQRAVGALVKLHEQRANPTAASEWRARLVADAER